MKLGRRYALKRLLRGVEIGAMGSSLEATALPDDVRLPLRVRPASRIAAFLTVPVIGLLALVLVLLLISIISTEQPSLGLGLTWALIALLLVGALWTMWIALREAVARPYICVGRTGVMIHQPMVLRGPLEVPLNQIAAAAVSTAESPGLWAEDDLPVEVEYEQGPITWTAGREENAAVTAELTRMLIPLLDRDPEVEPNLALVLREPIDVSKVRRSTFGFGGFRKSLIATKRTRGFLVAVRDADAADAAFTDLGLRRKLDRADRELLTPQSEDLARFRRAHHVAAFSFAYLILAVAYQVWIHTR